MEYSFRAIERRSTGVLEYWEKDGDDMHNFSSLYYIIQGTFFVWVYHAIHTCLLRSDRV